MPQPTPLMGSLLQTSATNPTHVPDWSTQSGWIDLNGTNTAIFSISNGWIHAGTADIDQDQVDTPDAVYNEAQGAGPTADILTHCNGLAGAVAFAVSRAAHKTLSIRFGVCRGSNKKDITQQ